MRWGTIQRVLEKVNALPQDKHLSAMTMLFGKEFGDDAANWQTIPKKLQRQLKLTAGNDGRFHAEKNPSINKDSLSAQWLLVKTGAQNTFSSLARRYAAADGYSVHGEKRHGGVASLVELTRELTGTLMKASAVVWLR